MKFFFAVIFTFIVTVVIFCIGGYYYLSIEMDKPLSLNGKEKVIYLPKGTSFKSLLSSLKQKKIISSIYPLSIYVRWHHMATKIQAGEYELNDRMNSKDLLSLLLSGKTVNHRFTIISGDKVQDALDQIAALPNIRHTLGDKILEKKLLKLLNVTGYHSLEGLLYPDTYEYKKNDTDLSLIKRAYLRLKELLDSEWKNRAPDLPLSSSYEALILASIVEKETGVAEERPKIAGVFIRRLKKHMRLQTDPTVIYGLGKAYKGNLTRKDLLKMTPYNTYRIHGLPPTPIAMAGKAAIHAVLHPEAGSALYFVGKGDGTHYFSDTLVQHNRAVYQYQIKYRLKNYQSSPNK
jgi:UPF0755 protein